MHYVMCNVQYMAQNHDDSIGVFIRFGVERFWAIEK